ncbi:MAG: shikimate kinase [Planctomycetia bacterium]|jgi:shikimate kinase
MPRLTLIGYRGTGKSTVAAALARRLGCEWRDADAVLEEKVGSSITRLARERGEPFFRDEESAVLARLLADFNGVLATGGGVVLKSQNRDLLRAQGRPIVWLTAAADVIRSRLACDPTTGDRRPALSGTDPLAEVAPALEAREPLYRQCADVAFDTGALDVEAIVSRIVAWLDERGEGERAPA